LALCLINASSKPNRPQSTPLAAAKTPVKGDGQAEQSGHRNNSAALPMQNADAFGLFFYTRERPLSFIGIDRNPILIR
jgi:hypothetical protein